MADEQAVALTSDEEMTTKGFISHRVDQSKALLHFAGISPAVFERVALNAILQNPDLAECGRDSLRTAIIRCAEMGLLPDGRQAAIWGVKERDKPHKTAICVPMIEGRLHLARKATPGIGITVRAVFEDEKEKFTHIEGLDPVLRHVPVPDADRRDEKVFAVYAIARIPGGAGPEFEVMYRSTINRYKNLSRAQGAGAPWKMHYAEMAKKTVLGQLLKRLPKMPGALDEDDVGDGIDGYQTMVDAEATMLTPHQRQLADTVSEAAPYLQAADEEARDEARSRADPDEPPLPEPPPPDPGEPIQPEIMQEAPQPAAPSQPAGARAGGNSPF